MQRAIHETLSVDVRSVYQESRAKSAEATIEFDRLTVRFHTQAEKVLVTGVEKQRQPQQQCAAR